MQRSLGSLRGGVGRSHLPWCVAVMRQGERDGAQFAKHAEDGQTSADSVAGLHADQAGDAALVVHGH